ncbi:MAG: HDIG domain-containing protein [Gemmatimonadota bacterium]|nr:HDIG domain-containing protein [Gemmatimonadota bacterium]
MNLWRRLSERDAAEESEPPERSRRENDAAERASFVPRLDLALEIAAIVARVILDPRVSFVTAIVVAVAVPGRTGELITALFVAIGSLLVYRAQRWQRIPDHLRWLSWADLNKPLLRRLSLEAPGTYAHTIAMANLTEAACNAIGADGLLGRVGAYYHDIGKLRKPQHFVENQPRGRNPHDKLKPSTSAAIIRSHVRDGVDLAKESGVPRPIRAFIAEHHGTLPIAYFLAKARERDDSVNATEYAYPGPIPQSAETAVCMLADAVEATVRSLPDPTPGAIRKTVETTVAKRLSEGQLADAPITLRQLSEVTDQFVRILTGMYHGRIEYPSSPGGLSLSPKPSSRASA